MKPEDLETGIYWDDNPFQIEVSGHLSIGTKKFSPGAHWILITGSACKKANTSFPQTAAMYMMVACAEHDAFISCWATKYKYNLIRPESYINRYIDAEWRPNIETPRSLNTQVAMQLYRLQRLRF